MDRTFTIRTSLSSLALAFITALSAACSGSLFKVKPVTELPALPTSAKSATAGVVIVHGAPLLSDEESQDLFEANLPLNGLLPVRIEMNYETGGEPLELKRARFRLHDGEGREWKYQTPKQAISRILKANGVTLYNPHSRKQFESDFNAYALDVKTPLSNAERHRRGFLFFQAPNKARVTSPHGLVLSITGLAQPVELQLN